MDRREELPEAFATAVGPLQRDGPGEVRAFETFVRPVLAGTSRHQQRSRRWFGSLARPLRRARRASPSASPPSRHTAMVARRSRAPGSVAVVGHGTSALTPPTPHDDAVDEFVPAAPPAAAAVVVADARTSGAPGGRRAVGNPVRHKGDGIGRTRSRDDAGIGR